jgi:hypothetical protein
MSWLVDAEARWAAIGIACCVVIALFAGTLGAAFKTLRSRSRYVEFLLYTVTLLWPVPVVLLTSVGGLRPAAVGGVAAALALDQAAAIGVEISVLRRQGSLFPIAYIFSLPGVLLGVLAIAVWLRATQQQIAPFDAFGISAAAAFTSAVISHAVVYYIFFLGKRRY